MHNPVSCITQCHLAMNKPETANVPGYRTLWRERIKYRLHSTIKRTLYTICLLFLFICFYFFFGIYISTPLQILPPVRSQYQHRRHPLPLLVCLGGWSDRLVPKHDTRYHLRSLLANLKVRFPLLHRHLNRPLHCRLNRPLPLRVLGNKHPLPHRLPRP